MNIAEGITYTEPEWKTISAKVTSASRVVHMVKPSCQVPVAVKDGDVYGMEMTTGPCQASVKDNPEREFTWFKTCTHGPERDEKGQPIPLQLRPYFEGNIVVTRTPKINTEGVVDGMDERPRWVVRLRLEKVSTDVAVMSGAAPTYHFDRGAKLASDFGITGICQMQGCWRRDTKRYAVAQGWFCSDIHAKVVKANEEGVILPAAGMIGVEDRWPAKPNREKRRELLQRVSV